MRNVTSAFKEALANDQREYIEYADFTLEDGTTLSLTNEHFWQNGFSYEDSVSPNDKFQVGSAVINKVNLTINNIYGDFDEYDFFGAVAIIGIGLEINGVVERVDFGEFTVIEQPDYNGSLISIELYDNMFKFDQPYSESTLVYPASLDTIIRDACTNCGVILGTTDFPNKTFVVQTRPDDDNLTYREVIAYAAQIAGCFARIEYSVEGHDGRLALRWFGTLRSSIPTFLPPEVFNTYEGMKTAWQDWDPSYTEWIADGVDWFTFDGKVVSNIYISSYGWIVLGGERPSVHTSNYTGDINLFKGNSRLLYVYESDGYETVGSLKYFKMYFIGESRFQPYYAFRYEIFLLSTGDIILNIISTGDDATVNTIVSNNTTTYLNVNVGTTCLHLGDSGWEQTTYETDDVYHIIDSVYSHRVSTDNIVVTGISVSMDVEHERTITEDGVSHTETVYEKAEYLEGTDGYVLAIENNPLIAESKIRTVAEYLGSRIIGYSFRKASITHGSNPSIEAGDVAYLVNGKGQTYPIIISQTKFAVGTPQRTESVAEDPVRNSAARFSVEAQNYAKARKRIAAEKTQRQIIEEEINARIDDAGGLYETVVQQQGGGVITYLHNLPELSESDIQIMISSVGVTVTANGTAQQPTWYGLTVDGTLLANILSVSGIHADWINTGQLAVTKSRERISQYFNTTDGMTQIVSTRQDDQNNTVTGVDWFVFDSSAYPAANPIGVNSNSIITFGYVPSSATSSTSGNLNVCRTDGQLLRLYRQEGTCGDLDFLKLRYEGYTRYSTSYQVDEYKLTYEVFLLSDNTMLLHIIDLPTNTSYLGSSSVSSTVGTTSFVPEKGTLIFRSEGGLWSPKKFYDPNEVFFADFDTGTVRISGNSVNITAGDAVDTAISESKPITYGTSTTAANTSAKVVSATGFKLENGAQIAVKFTYANTASAPTLNVNSTGAKSIYAKGAVLDAKYDWTANSLVQFTYDGTYWVMDVQDQDEIFKRLTNNGTAQGIFLQNGQLYINMSYLQTGTLKVGGASNGNGIFEVYNASGTRVGLWNNGALYVGNISGTSSTPSSPNTKIDTAGAITTKSLTANDYIYVDGNTQSFIRIPIPNYRSGAVVEIGSDGILSKSPSDSIYTRLLGVDVANNVTTRTAGLYCGNLSSAQEAIVSGKCILVEPTTLGFYDLQSARTGLTQISSKRLWMSSNASVQLDFNLDKTTASFDFVGNVSVSGNFSVSGTKPRLVTTEDYGKRYLYCYETPSPLFGDVGEGVISDDGKCYVQIDNIFAETVTLNQYQVFLQKYGEGECWVSERNSSYFVVEGTEGLKFGWEIKAKQSDFDQYRLEKEVGNLKYHNETDYINELIAHIHKIKNEREVSA